jgi:hypothetical protein
VEIRICREYAVEELRGERATGRILKTRTLFKWVLSNCRENRILD